MLCESLSFSFPFPVPVLSLSYSISFFLVACCTTFFHWSSMRKRHLDYHILASTRGIARCGLAHRRIESDTVREGREGPSSLPLQRSAAFPGVLFSSFSGVVFLILRAVSTVVNTALEIGYRGEREYPHCADRQCLRAVLGPPAHFSFSVSSFCFIHTFLSLERSSPWNRCLFLLASVEARAWPTLHDLASLAISNSRRNSQLCRRSPRRPLRLTTR